MNNSVTISGGTVKGYVAGGYSYYGIAKNNTVTILGGTVEGDVDGGNAWHDATGNTVTISDGGTVEGSVYGGYSEAGKSRDNTVTISGGATVEGNVYGGWSYQGDASDNTVTISSGATVEGAVYGGRSARGNATGNTVTISGDTVKGDVYGGYSHFGAATGNTVNIFGGTFTSNINIYGGYSASSTNSDDVTSGNTLHISSKATFSGTATAYNFETIAFADSGNYTLAVSTAGDFTDGGAEVTTTLAVGEYDVTLAGDISNGGSNATTLNIIKTGTGTLTLSGTNSGYTGLTTVQEGTLSIAKEGALSGGSYTVNSGARLDFSFAKAGTVHNSIEGAGDVTVHATDGVTVTFSGEKTYTGWTKIYSGILDASTVNLSSTSLYMEGGTTFHAPGNSTSNVDTYTLATFVVNARNGKSVNYKGTDLVMAGGGTLDIQGPAKVNSTALLLVEDGSATLDGINYSYTATGAVPLLQTGERIYLVKASDGLSAVGATGTYNVMTGTTIIYDLAEEILASDGELNLVVTGVGAAPQAKALLEGTLAGSALVAQGADLVAGRGMEAAMNATMNTTRGTDGFTVTPFAAVQGGSMRYNSGSHIDMQSLNLMAGLAAGSNTPAGDLTVGAFFEYGNGSYNTFNSFNTGSFDGNGNTSFVGWGLLGRMDFLDMDPGHFYVEASGRMGGLYNTYENQDMRDYAGRVADYDRYNAYYGFHAGLGYVFDFTETAHLDVHGKYFWTRVDGEELTLSTGETLEFEDVTSSRLRFGTRFTLDVNEKVRPYIGVAYEHEFDGRARGTTMGYEISSPSLKGDTGIGEIGISLAPEELPITLDFAVQGYVGKREGVTGSMFFKYAF